MAQNQTVLFRKKTMDKISSPDHLTEYLRVTSLGMWVILAAAVILLVGMLVWASVGTLETKTPAKIVVEDHTARISTVDAESISGGMTIIIDDNEYMIASVDLDEFGREIGIADISLPDGTYDGTVITSSTKPIDFLFERG